MNNILHFSPMLAAMRPDILVFLRVIGLIAFLVLIPVGVLLYRKQDQWFGRYSDSPHETSGSLGYGRMQCWLAYLGFLHLALYVAFGL